MNKKQEDFNRHMDKFLTFLDGLEVGLLRTHELVGTVSDHASELLSEVTNAAEAGVLKAVDILDSYRDEVRRRAAEQEAKLGTPSDTKLKDAPANKSTEPKSAKDMTREEKIAFLKKEYGIQDTPEQDHVFKTSSDESLTHGVEVLLRRKRNQDKK